jgi:intracellular sulfur oxidation DsrE/DsrF family protein
MKLRHVLALFVLGCTLLALPVSASAQAKSHRVLFAVTSPDEADWHLAMGNMRNLISGLAPDTVEIEVVAFGPGLSLVKKASVVESEIKALQAKHVRFVACENAMRAQHVTVADLLEGVGTVPAGIVEVVTKQEQGWTYIKAGR